MEPGNGSGHCNEGRGGPDLRWGHIRVGRKTGQLVINVISCEVAWPWARGIQSSFSSSGLISASATAAAARSRKSNLTLGTIFGSYKAYNPLGSITRTCAVAPLEDRIVMLLLGAALRNLADTDDPQAQRGLCIVTDALMS